MALFVHGGPGDPGGDPPAGLRRLDRAAAQSRKWEKVAAAWRCWWRLQRGTLLDEPRHELSAPARSRPATPRAAALCRRASSNFPASFLLLPPRQAPRHGRPVRLHASYRRPGRRAWSRRLARRWPHWRRGLEAALTGDLQCGAADAMGGTATRRRSANALARRRAAGCCCRRWPMRSGASRFRRNTCTPCSTAWRWTSPRPRYETFADLAALLRAGGLGRRAGLHPRLGIPRPGGLGAGPRRGIAMQLTNILRDLRKTPAGRIYLPLEDLRQCGYSVERLQRGAPARRFAA